MARFPSWVGMDKALALLAAAEPNIVRKGFADAEAAVQDAAAEARRIVPVDTGYLRSSIFHAAERRRHGWSVTLGAEAHYAGFVEWGTSRMAAQPYLRPAYEQMIERLGA